jgi:hypothetical protein
MVTKIDIENGAKQGGKQEGITKNKKERTLLPHKRQTPRKRVHKVGQPIRVCRRIVLPNRDILVRVFQDSTAVVVHVQIVGRGEDGDDRRKVAFGCFAVHGVSEILMGFEFFMKMGYGEGEGEGDNIPCILCFMSADESEQPIAIQELADGVIPSKKNTTQKRQFLTFPHRTLIHQKGKLTYRNTNTRVSHYA